VTICGDCFQEFLHPLVHESIEKNNRFREKYGQHERWDWDPDSATLIFSDAGLPSLRVHCSVVGTTRGNQWEWGWANRNIPDSEKRDMELVRNFGEASGYGRLTSPFLDADEYTGWEMTAVAVHLLEALGSYRFPTDQGYCYLVFREVEEVSTEQRSTIQ